MIFKIEFYMINKTYYTNNLKEFLNEHKNIIKGQPFKLYEKINNEYILNGWY